MNHPLCLRMYMYCIDRPGVPESHDALVFQCLYDKCIQDLVSLVKIFSWKCLQILGSVICAVGPTSLKRRDQWLRETGRFSYVMAAETHGLLLHCPSLEFRRRLYKINFHAAGFLGISVIKTLTDHYLTSSYITPNIQLRSAAP